MLYLLLTLTWHCAVHCCERNELDERNFLWFLLSSGKSPMPENPFALAAEETDGGDKSRQPGSDGSWFADSSDRILRGNLRFPADQKVLRISVLDTRIRRRST